MWSSAILSNPRARVYNLRVLIIGALVAVGFTLDSVTKDSASLGAGCLILAHHPLALFASHLRLAAVDLLVTALEIILVSYSGLHLGLWSESSILMLLAPLVAAVVFRVTTIRASPEPFWHQKVAFLGGCSPSNPPYTPWRILVNRSLGRPLVRGEFSGIIVVRALILSAVTVALPTFAVYSIVWIPLQAQVITSVIDIPSGSQWQPDGNVSMAFSFGAFDPVVAVTPNVTAFMTIPAENGTVRVVGVICPSQHSPAWTDLGTIFGIIANCPITWTSVLNISMTLAYPAEMDLQPAIWVVPGQGDITDIVAFTDPIVVPPRSHMLAYLTWTSRQIYTTPSSRLLGPFTRLRTVTNMEVSMVLNTENWEPPSALSSTLVLVQREPYITRFFQDSAATPLDGISAFGGAWTFLNGAFLLLFGANIMYFAFGRRPLSALGIAHLCQRRDLTRQWHEDFPALQTEGGQPGSESAGIVAFIRERLLDIELNEDTGEHATAVHVESHELSNENSNPAISALTTLATPTNGGRDGNLVSREGLEYRLDEIPLMSLKGEVGQ